MDRTKAAVAARSALLLAVAAATTNRLVTGLCAFAVIRIFEHHWENQP
jgi:hypothetical protein